MPRNDRIVRVETVKSALLSSRQGVSLKVLADRHDWKLRNLYRDIDALESAGYIIRHENNRYWIEGTRERAASAPDADERLALYLARQNARAWKETSLGKALRSPVASRERHRRRPGRPGSCRVSALDHHPRVERHRLRRPPADFDDPGTCHAALETLYLIAWCRLRQDVRVFAVHRFLAVALTDEICPPRSQTRSAQPCTRLFACGEAST